MTDLISILAGGWSVRREWLERIPGHVIAVNDAAIWSPRVDELVSMDRLWTEARFPWLVMHHAPRPAHVRHSALKNILSRPEWLKIFDNDHTLADMTDEPGWLNGTNSGLCAMNLAYQRRPRRVLLFGFDMNRSPKGSPYWFKPYPWAKPGGATSGGKYRAWAAEFELVARQFKAAGIEVFNASPTSDVWAFPKIAAEEVLT